MKQCRQSIWAIAAAWLVFAAAWNAVAQPPEPPKALQVEGPIQYVGPDTYLLIDAAGRPQPVLGMSYDEFVAAWKKLQHIDGNVEEPRYALEALRIVGRARDDRAELDVEATIRLRTDEPIRLPLGLAGAMLQEQPHWETLGNDGPRAAEESAGESAGEPTVDYDPRAGGFVARIQGRADQRRKLSMQMLVPLVRDGNETTVRLNCPRALVSSLALAVPTAIVDATVSEGALVTKEAAEGGGTRLSVDGLTGDFRLTWNTAEAGRRELSTVLSATGVLSISIDGHSIRSDARLTVRSYGGSFDRVRVRLPPGAKLIQERPGNDGGAATDYRLTLEDAAPAVIGGVATTADATQVVAVEFAEKQFGPVEVALSTEQPLGLASAEQAVELAGFEVLGAVRQYGDVAIHVADDWQPRWESGPYVRQVENSDLAPALGQVQPTAAFQYDRQPWTLRARIVARPMVVQVTPAYDLELGPDEAQLHVRLSYQIPGARAFEFRVRLQGWQLTSDPIESGGLVDRNGVLVTRDGLLVLPLAQASSRRADVSFGLRRAVPRDAADVALPLPVPEADAVAAADLTVAADAAIELLPDRSRWRGLSPTPVTNDAPPELSADGRQFFRYRAFQSDPVFAAKRTIRPGEVAVEMETALAVDWQGFQATQEIGFLVRYQPLDELVFDLPSGWALVDGQVEILTTAPDARPIVVSAEVEPEPTDQSTRRVRVVLPQPRLGSFQVRLRYEAIESDAFLGDRHMSLTLPQPAIGRITSHRVRVAGTPDMAVSLDPSAGSSWQPVDESTNSSDEERALVVEAGGPQVKLPLVVEPIAHDRPQAATVERVWLQTWQAGDTIQDRAAIRFRTTGPAVTVELPPLVAVREVEVLVDGRLAEVSARQEGRLQVELPALPRGGSDAGVHTLEMRFRHPVAAGRLARHELTPPQLVGSSALCEVYWQVVLPGDRHVVRSPAQLVAAEASQWLDVFLGRRPGKHQADLEAWAGATSQLAPSEAQNAYLFSGIAPVGSLEVFTAPRWLIVLVVSGAVLALACLWMYVPLVRRGWIGILAGVTVAGLAVTFPSPALLVGQASVLGVAAAAVALALRRWLDRPAERLPTSAGSTNLRVRSSYRSDSIRTPPLAPSGSGTPTLPITTVESDR